MRIMCIIGEFFYIFIVILIIIGTILLLLGTAIILSPVLICYIAYILIRDYKFDKKHKIPDDD